MITAQERRLMAVHEAGHAIVALHTGQDVTELRIGEEGGHSIKLLHARPRSWHACSALAGSLACRIHCRDFPDLEKWNGWENCHNDLRIFNTYRGGMTYRQGRRIALDILREREPDLLELAGILERDGFVDHTNAPRRFAGKDTEP